MILGSFVNLISFAVFSVLCLHLVGSYILSVKISTFTSRRICIRPMSSTIINENEDFIDTNHDEPIAGELSSEKLHQFYEELEITNILRNKTKVDPVQRFNQFYKDLKSNDKRKNINLDPAAILASLFEDSIVTGKVKDPLDEKTIFIQAKQSLDKEDFRELFGDEDVGDFF